MNSPALPSNIARHPKAQAVDRDGDGFPSNSNFYLTNVCSDGHQSLTVTPGQSAAYTHFVQDTPDRKWTIEYQGDDRSTITIRSVASGGYLASSTAQYGSSLYLSQEYQPWHVYQGAAPGSFWLSTAQGPDRFMHTWNCNGNDSADVCIFTNQDQNSGRFYGLSYDAWEEFTTGLSWYFEPTPEYREWKQNNPQQQQQQPQQNSQQPPQPDLEQQRQALAQREAAVAQQESALQQREKDVSQHETDLSRRDTALSAREAAAQRTTQDAEKALTAAQGQLRDADARTAQLTQQAADLQKREDALQKREDRLAKDEQQLKKSRNAKPAENLALSQDLDKARQSAADLQATVDQQTAELAALRARLAQLEASTAKSSSTTARRAAAVGSIGAAIDAPARLVPKRVVPPRFVPTKSLSDRYDGKMLKRFQEGKKIVSEV